MNSNSYHRPPTNYAIKAGNVISIGVAIMFAVVMCPFCTLHRTMLLTRYDNAAQAAVAAVITGLHVETSLLTIDVAPICGDEFGELIGKLTRPLGKAVRAICVGGGRALWGKHLVFDMNSHACNLEEQLRASGMGLARSVGGDVGCIQFNIAKIVSVVALGFTLAAAIFHVLAVVHTQLYYSVDSSRRRRCIAVSMWALGPACATCGAMLYYALVNPSRLILQGLFKPPPGQFYPLGWGTVWWALCLALSFCNCIGMIMNMDHLLAAETVHKYAEYESLSAQKDAYYAAVEQPYGALEKGVPVGYGYGYGPASGETYATTADTGAPYLPRYG